MSNTQKQELITEIVTLLQAKLNLDIKSEISEIHPNTLAKSVTNNATLEMLTIKECCGIIKGLSEHTVRQLVKQNKLPHIRTGAGKNGKILISRNALTEYFSNIQAERGTK